MARRMKREGPAIEARPLYAQIRNLMLSRIGDGTWKPGMLLPSELQLADELEVSQGTVRKALDELAAQNIVVRRQGRGTFISTHDAERALNHFFHLVADDGTRRLPESKVLGFTRAIAESGERRRLALAAGAGVLRITRLRFLGGKPAIHETISVPAALIPELGGSPEANLPTALRDLYQASSNTLYDLYHARFGIVIVKAVERLRAVAATREESQRLKVPARTPLLEIDRVAIDVRGRPVEWRLSRALTLDHHYLAEIE
jgi:GntR family transcriptional regulator